MKVHTKKTADLIPYENNPRRNDKAVDAVAASIREFGFKVPIIIDKENVVVAGHTRLKAAQKLEIEEVPVIIADDLTEEQVKAFRLADNKTAELAEWDFDSLIPELQGIAELDMSAFGFDEGLDEEDYYLKKQNETEKNETPGSRVIIAGISLFGSGSELFAIKEISPEESEKILENMNEDTAGEICEKIKSMLGELTA